MAASSSSGSCPIVKEFNHPVDKVHSWINQYNGVLYVHIAQKVADNQFVISMPASRILHLRFAVEFLLEHPESRDPVNVAFRNYGKLEIQLFWDGQKYYLRETDTETKQFLKTIVIGEKDGFIIMLNMMAFSHKLMEQEAEKTPKKKKTAQEAEQVEKKKSPLEVVDVGSEDDETTKPAPDVKNPKKRNPPKKRL